MADIHLTALRHSAFYTPYLLCIAGGFLKRQGLNPYYTPGSADNPADEALRTGRCQVSQSAVATSFAALESGAALDIVHFAQINARDGFFIAARRPMPEFQWQDLTGGVLLADHFFQPLAMLNYALHRQGVAWQSIDADDAGDVDAMDQAFRSGRGDFIHQQGPAPQQLERDGIGHVVASVGDAIGPVAFSSLCAQREWLDTDMAQAFMQAYREARRAAIETDAGYLAKQLAALFPAIDSAVLANTIGTYQQLGCWEPSVTISAASYNTLLDVFLHSGAITQRHPMDACVVQPPGA